MSAIVEGYINGIRQERYKSYTISIDGIGEITIKHDTINRGKFPIHINDYVKITIEVTSNVA